MNSYKLKDLLSIKNGKDHKELNDGNIPVFGSGGIMRYGDKALFEDESILLPRKGTLSNIQYVNEPFWTVDTIYYSVVNKKLANPFYLFNYLKSLDLSNLNSGTGVPSMTFNSYYDLHIKLPDLSTQKAIAKVLSDLDAKIELNNRINRELEAMAKTLYDYWFVQFDFPVDNNFSTSGEMSEGQRGYKSSGGKMVYNPELKREIPEGWEVGTVEDYCRIFTGKKDVNQSLEIGKYKFFSCAPGYKYSDEKLYEGKAILVSGNGSYTGRTIFVDEGFDLYQRTYACVNKTETDYLAYIYYSMLRYMSLKINGGTHGSAIPYIVFDDIAKEIIVINHNLINKFQNIVYPLINKIMNNNKQAVELAKLRDWLLPMLMNGQVTVSEL